MKAEHVLVGVLVFIGVIAAWAANDHTSAVATPSVASADDDRAWVRERLAQSPPTPTAPEAAIDGMPISWWVAKLRVQVGDAELTAKEAQVCLRAAGFNIQADGIMGPETQSAFNVFVKDERAVGSNDMKMYNCLNAVFVHRIVNDYPPTTVTAQSPAPRIATPQEAAGLGVASAPAAVDYSGRTEHVSGYTRKNGTYVAPYMRHPSH